MYDFQGKYMPTLYNFYNLLAEAKIKKSTQHSF